MKSLEKKFEKDSIKIFNALLKINKNSNLNIIDYDTIRKNLSLTYDNKNKNKLPFYKLASTFNFSNSIKEGNFKKNTFNKETFNEKQFVDYSTGKIYKDLIFENDNISEKRFQIEEYMNLYQILGGKEDGIKKEDIKSIIEEVYLNLNNVSIPTIKLEKEINEIFKYLSEEGNENLSMNDFLNIITCNTPLPKDNDNIF